jgi:hypothetical protein
MNTQKYINQQENEKLLAELILKMANLFNPLLPKKKEKLCHTVA